MNPQSDDPQPGKPARMPEKMTRDERLKAALKANMARRKAQARARSGGQDKAVSDGDNKNE